LKESGDLESQFLGVAKPGKVDFHDVHACEVPSLFPQMVAEQLEYCSEIGKSHPERGWKMGVLGESKIEVPGKVVDTLSQPGEALFEKGEGVTERGDQEMVFFDDPFGQEVTEEVPPVHGFRVLLRWKDIQVGIEDDEEEGLRRKK